MTKIEAIVRPSALERLQALCSHPWLTSLSISEVKGVGRQRGHTEVYRGAEYVVELRPKLKVELVVPTPLAPRIAADLERLLRTGRIGDGKVFLGPVDEAVGIETGERGEQAL